MKIKINFSKESASYYSCFENKTDEAIILGWLLDDVRDDPHNLINYLNDRTIHTISKNMTHIYKKENDILKLENFIFIFMF